MQITIFSFAMFVMAVLSAVGGIKIESTKVTQGNHLAMWHIIISLY